MSRVVHSSAPASGLAPTLSLMKSRQRGSTLLGLIIGLVLGLGIAVVVAMFVTRATIPFVNKAPRPVAAVEPEGTKLPDPNRSLYPKDAPVASAAPSAAVASTPAADSTVIAPPPPNLAPGADGKPVVDRSAPSTGITTLQAGAFSTSDDAESMRGRLALLGIESRVQPGDREGGKIYRVRLGPYSRIEDLNRTRQRLIENGVEATLVAPGK